MPNITVTEFMDIAAIETLRRKFDVMYDPSLFDDTERLHKSLAQTRAILVRNRTKVDDRLLSKAPCLECVGRLGVGLDNIDLDACEVRNIAVYPAFGANDLSVAEYVVTSAMMLMRRAFLSSDKMLDGSWPRQACSGNEISGKAMGLIGFGRTARRTADLAQAIGLQVFAHDPHLPLDHPAWSLAERLELSELLAVADVVSLHIPLLEDTRHLVDSDLIATMKPGAILINASRGGIVDESALVSAIREGLLGGAALDVFETEPLTIEAAQKFEGLRNILLTPHIAGVTEQSNARVSSLIAEKVAKHLSGAAGI